MIAAKKARLETTNAIWPDKVSDHMMEEPDIRDGSVTPWYEFDHPTADGIRFAWRLCATLKFSVDHPTTDGIRSCWATAPASRKDPPDPPRNRPPKMIKSFKLKDLNPVTHLTRKSVQKYAERWNRKLLGLSGRQVMANLLLRNQEIRFFANVPPFVFPVTRIRISNPRDLFFQSTGFVCFQSPGFGVKSPGFMFPVQRIRCPVHRIRFSSLQDSLFRVPRIRFPIHRIRFSSHQDPCFQFTGFFFSRAVNLDCTAGKLKRSLKIKPFPSRSGQAGP